MINLTNIILDFILLEKAVNFLTLKVPKPNFKYLALISVTILVILIHVLFFLFNKQDNLFEVFDVPRVFDQDLLKANYKKLINLYHPDKRRDNSEEQIDFFKSIKDDYAFLSNGDYRTLYDKYNEKKMDQGVHTLSHTLMYSKVIENLVFYLILLVICAFVTTSENLKSGRKWLVAILVLFYSVEVTYILYEKNQKDFLDLIFPSMTLFERISLGREILFTLLTSVRLNYKLFYVSPLKKVGFELKNLMEKQSTLKNKLKSIPSGNTLEKNLDNIQEQLEKTCHLMENQDVKTPAPPRSGWRNYVFYILMFIFLALVYTGSKQSQSDQSSTQFEFDFDNEV